MVIEKGKLIRWIDDKGFGFIKPESGENDIFIHISAIRGMSRKPIIGDVIHYQIGFDNNGQVRAVNAKIEGVSQLVMLTPQERKQKSNRTLSIVKDNSYRKTPKATPPKKKSNLLAIIMLILVAIVIFQRSSKHRNIDEVKMPSIETKPITQTEQFQCQGKVWCSQMSSYEEAIFYLHNCPDTKMDGDGDGVPCEQQF
jgi:cold shock CspA family protein